MNLVVIVPQLLVVALLVAAFLALWLDRYHVEPVPLLLGAGLWGFGLPVAASALCSYVGWPQPDPLAVDSAAAPGAATLVVAVFAILTPVAVIGATRFVEGPADAAVVGLAAGLGLAASSTVRPSEAGATATIAGVVFAVLLNGAVAATLGAGIGLTKLAAPPELRLAGVVASLAVAGAEFAALAFAAVSCRRAWGVDDTLCQSGLAVLAATALASIYALSLAFEKRVLSRQLDEEVELGVLPAWVVEIVPRYRRRIRTDWWPRRDERQEIVRLLVGLAFRKHQLRNLSAERLRLYGLEVGRLRQRARILLALAPAQDAGRLAMD